MTKLCSVCGTENREEAQFCRSCGTAFSAQLPRAAGDDAAQQNVCAECGFQNKPGLRYCANCGMSLAAGAAADAGPATGSPPPLSYPSFAPVAPYPPAPVGGDAVPDLPDPDAEIALRQQEATDADSSAMPFESAPSRGRAPIVIGAVAVALVVAGALAWTYMGRSDSSPPAIGATTTPVVPTVPASAAPPPVAVEEAASAPATVAAPASAIEAPPAPATTTAPATTAAPVDTTPPAAARPLPQIGDAVQPESAEAEAKRVAAERRARAARDKAERDAKASAADREQQAAAQREQDAQARRRAEEAQRARPAPAPAPPAPAPVAQGRTVRDICAGRGTIAEAVCQSRTCGQAEHANEPICRQLREQDDRRRNFGG